MIFKNQYRLFLLLAFIIPVLVYIQTIGFGFVYLDDNRLIIDNTAFLSNFRNAGDVFFTDAFLTRSSYFYRPVQVLSYMVDIMVSGGSNAWVFHFTNVLLFGLTGLMLMMVLFKLLNRTLPAITGTLIYCVHPLFVFSVAWIPARGDLLLTFFTLLSFLAFLNYLNDASLPVLIFHWAGYTAALFCKESAIVLPVVFLIYRYYFNRDTPKYWPLLLVLYVISWITWFILRNMAIGDLTSVHKVNELINNNELTGMIPVLLNLRTIPESLFSFFIPVSIAPLPGYTWWRTLGGICIIMIMIYLIFFGNATNRKMKLFGLCWYLLLLAPTFIFRHRVIDYLNHRFLLPLVGMLIAALFCMPEKWIDIKNRLFYLISGMVIVLFSITSFLHTRVYSDPLTFYNAAIRKNPKSTMAYLNRGTTYQNSGQPDKALADYNKAIALQPDYADTYINRGNVFLSKQAFMSAISDFTSAIQLGASEPELYNNRGVAYYKLGLSTEACNDFNYAAISGSKSALLNRERFCK
jgi:tetratricopeptide (TPR) repeat protein